MCGRARGCDGSSVSTHRSELTSPPRRGPARRRGESGVRPRLWISDKPPPALTVSWPPAFRSAPWPGGVAGFSTHVTKASVVTPPRLYGEDVPVWAAEDVSPFSGVPAGTQSPVGRGTSEFDKAEQFGSGYRFEHPQACLPLARRSYHVGNSWPPQSRLCDQPSFLPSVSFGTFFLPSSSVRQAES